jgi:hypothetical protein
MSYRAAIIAAGLIVGLVQIAVWAADRDPPFEILSSTPAQVRAGSSALLTGKTRRDLNRHCNAQFQRSLVTKDGYRLDLEGTQYASAERIAEFEATSPGEIRVVVDVPAWLQPGRAEVVTWLQYQCNPLHRWWPIHVTTRLPLEVIP